MKRIAAILFILISFSFIFEQSLLPSQKWNVAMEQEAPTDTNEEQQQIIEEDLKEKYCSTSSPFIIAPALLPLKVEGYHLQHSSSGFTNKPYMPPEVI